MLDWEIDDTAQIALARTPLARLSVALDPAVSTVDHWRYRAHVSGLSGAVLAHADNLPSLDAARAWCEEQYRMLLESELERLRIVENV